jgi:hypothetical protein
LDLLDDKICSNPGIGNLGKKRKREREREREREGV